MRLRRGGLFTRDAAFRTADGAGTAAQRQDPFHRRAPRLAWLCQCGLLWRRTARTRERKAPRTLFPAEAERIPDISGPSPADRLRSAQPDEGCAVHEDASDYLPES